MKKQSKSSKIAEIVLVLLSLICVAVIAVCGYNVYKNKVEIDKVLEVQEATEMKTEVIDPFDYMSEFNELKAQNSDFIGWIRFDSDLINLPILYSSEDDYYLRRDFNKDYSAMGSIFMDYQQSLDSRNITLYGHYVYADSEAMFTPLEKFMKEENYQENKVFKFYLEDEIRTYEVCAVVRYTMGETHSENNLQDWYFNVPSYSNEEWTNFITYATSHSLYDTGVQMDSDNRYVTLQTCIRGSQDDRLIVVGKEVKTELNK